MKLKQLIDSFSSLSECSDLDLETEVTGITDDSRKVVPGMIFIAIKGYQFDGHQYILDAAKNGASLIIGETVLSSPLPKTTTYIIVENTRQMLGQLANIYYGNPSADKIVIGVTGTNGKTTTSYLMKHLLDKLGYTTSIIGTIEYVINGKKIKSSNTTPSALQIHELMAQSNDQVFILEVSSHGLIQYRLEGITFDYALFTNLQHDHLDYHKTMEDYFEAKALLFNKLKANGTAVINLDDSWGKKLAQRTVSKGTNTVTVGFDKEAEVKILTKENSNIQLEINHQPAVLHSPLMGMHNVFNLSMASAVILNLGHTIDDINQNLLDFGGVPGRLETVANIDGVFYVVDYAHTDLALKYCLESINEYNANKVFHIFGFRGNRDPSKRLPMIHSSHEISDCTILTSDDLNGVSQEEMSETYRTLIDEAGLKDHVQIIMDRTLAIQEAQKMAQPGDYIVLTGKGPEEYTTSFQMGTHTDKETILQLKKRLEKA